MSASKLKTYQNYIKSNIESVPSYPSHWELKRVKYLIEETDGVKIGPFGSSLKLNTLTSDGIKIYGQGNVIKNDFTLGHRHLPIERFNSDFSQYEILDGDVLITMMGTTGKSKVFRKEFKRGIIDSHLMRVRFQKNQFNSDLFVIILQESEYMFNQVKLKSKGSIMEGLNSSIVKDLYVIKPPIGEQKQIERFLHRANEQISHSIENLESQQSLIEEKRSALITQAVTKGLNPGVPMKDSRIDWIGKIPTHWKIVPLKHLVTINDDVLNENTPENYEIVYVDIGNVKSGRGIVGSEKLRFEASPSRARRIAINGDIAISTVRTYLKAVCVVRNPPPNLILSTGFAVIRPHSIITEFAGFLLSSEYFVSLVSSHSEGVSYPAINSSEIGNLPVCLPPEDEQIMIAEYLEKNSTIMNKEKDIIELQITKLKEYKNSLISAAVTGKIDVRGL
ncbi:MAG: hypothetical protein CMQ27_09870 [Gammaproteobacteria bacterium]|nr:hypothetical protein [Gammaproteobacteria bacterium]